MILKEYVDPDIVVLCAWMLAGLVIWGAVITALYHNKTYRSWHYSRRRVREFCTLAVCLITGPVAIIFAHFFSTEGLRDSDFSVKSGNGDTLPRTMTEVPIGIMPNSVAFIGARDACVDAIGCIFRARSKNPVDVIESLQRWSLGYSNSHKTLMSLFNPKGDVIVTYVYGAETYQVESINKATGATS